MKAYYVTKLLKQGIKTKTMCPNYILEFRNTKWQRNEGLLYYTNC